MQARKKRTSSFVLLSTFRNFAADLMKQRNKQDTNLLLPVTKYAEMKKIYKAHIFYTKEQNRFEVLENGYVAVSADGHVKGVATDLSALADEEAEVIDFGDRLLIPAMNDLHVHASQ